jgi:REP element-mobilizing transposase RayT
MTFRTHGGKRRGAGRKPKGERAGVSHLRRPVLKARFPVHVTLRVAEGVCSLRSGGMPGRLTRAFYESAHKFGYRVVHYAILGNHVHLLVEAGDERVLARGMQSLGIRVAQGANRLMGRARGRVLADRYHARILMTPTEVRHCVCYLQTNAQKHYGRPGPDPFTSYRPFMAPRTWLARQQE